MIKKIKDNPIQAIIIGIVLLFILVIVLAMNKSDKSKSTSNKFVLPTNKMSFEELQKGNNAYDFNKNRDKKPQKKTRVQRWLDSIEKSKEPTIKSNISQTKEPSDITYNTNTTYNRPPPPVRRYTKKTIEIKSERQLLLEAKQRRNSNNIIINSKKKEKINTTFRATIYQDQFVLPSDRITLLLTDDFIYNNQLFKKNTFIYSVITIRKARVLIDITNINHIPVEFSGVDMIDGNIGLYSKRAGELWAEFEQESQEATSKDTSKEIVNELDLSVGSGAINAFQSFFTKKKLKKREKILLINNHELIFKYIEK